MLEVLTHVVNEYTPRGDIGKLEDEDIAQRLEWEGDAGSLVRSLVASGWLDPHPIHRFIMHDWPEHAPSYTKRNVKGTPAEPGPGWAVDDEAETQATESTPESIEPEDSRIPQNSPEDSSLPILSHPIQTNPIISPETRAPPSPPKKAGGKKRKTLAPQRLANPQLLELHEWVAEKQPWAKGQLVEFIDACLEHHRSKNTQSTDWTLNVRAWIRNDKKWHPEQHANPRPTPSWEPPTRPPGDEPLIADMTDEQRDELIAKNREGTIFERGQ